MAQTIVTQQAPAAKPISRSVTLGTTNTLIVDPDNFKIPVQGGAFDVERVAPGVAEITSPLILTNTSEAPRTVTVVIRRQNVTDFVIANEVRIEVNDTIYIPLNGQFFLSGTQDTTIGETIVSDKLFASASAGGTVVATISFTLGQAEEDDPFIGIE